MIAKEYYENGILIFARSLFEIWGFKTIKYFNVNIFGKRINSARGISFIRKLYKISKKMEVK